ncbi:hypothetical protein QFZ34_002884 [Phyllobacterium ifriqiyense]|uniref:DUF4139 domain-containing protein n=1 Tax=Phyllobacterium ifriqiyense TaxID=314238 RepID=A0ABU0SAC8_9HYPH|nr:DUF4139 domain-containing protein [Phyllobacterium ifriqiyense]MDQ0997702.1 hypothetical protein [Phyllobacterium ifriqiyense]
MALKRQLLPVLLFPLICTTALAAVNGPVKSVTLSSGGLSEIVRSANVGDNSEITINVPLDQVDDILKSLIIRDANGKVKNLSLAGPNPLEETFRTLPFSVDDLNSLPRLLNAVKGTGIRISGARELEGSILGVEYQTGANGAQNAVLSILTVKGDITTVPLDSSVSVEILDKTLNAKIADATLVAGKGAVDGSRTIKIELDGQGTRTVDISYVVSAPIWKTSYRMVTGENGTARLQAWAIFENASGEDWNDVSIVLSSGKPVTLKQALHRRYWKDRAELVVDTSAQNPAIASLGTSRRQKLAQEQDAAAGYAAPAPEMQMPQRPIEMAPAAQQTAIEEQEVTSNFSLPGQFDLKNGETISVPLLDKDVKVEMVSVYQVGRSGEHPTASVMLENDSGSSFPQGILTVYNGKSGYVGDAQIAGMPSGEKRAASFALDQKVSVGADTKPQRMITSIKVVDGIIHAKTLLREVTIFTVNGAADGDRTVLIEQEKRPGWTFRAENTADSTLTHDRVRIALKAGETRNVETVSEQTQAEEFALSDAAPQMITSWADAAEDPEVKTKLKELAEARMKQVDAQEALDRVQREYDQVAESQDRTRENLRAVPNGDLQSRYLAQMGEEEDRLGELRKERDAAQEIIGKFNEDVTRIIRTF